jgi:hypothetical protein
MGAMTALASHARRAEAWFGLVWLVGSVVAVVAALWGWGCILVVALVATYVGDAYLYAAPELGVVGWLGRREMAAAERALFREAVALLGWLQIAEPGGVVVALATAAIAVVHATHAGHRLMSLRNRRQRRGRLSWRNLDVDGRLEGPEVLPPTLPVVGPVSGARVALAVDLGVVGGMAVSWLVGSDVPAVAGAGAVLVGAALVTGRVLARTRLIDRLPTPQVENDRLLAALAAHAPQVAVYFSGGPDTTYQLNVWLETIDRIHQPAVIYLRERHHLDELLPTSTPVVVLPRARDVEAFQLGSIRVALYPTTVNKNNHMIRLRGIRHIFINHGDGDKSVTYSPLHRVFDEIWVAGRAACDRYLTRGEGIRAEQLVTVGRPQLAHIRRPGAKAEGARRTVLYAPTWEGNFDGVDYSSVARMGELIARTLLDPALDVRLLFKAHPATGTRLGRAAEARQTIERLIREAGGDHAVVGNAPDALYTAFNDSDVLVADISSVVADFLASRKPYLVTNPLGITQAAFHAEFPSASGGGIVTGDADDLRGAVRDALGADSLRQRREELATYFLGAPVDDPVEHFVRQLDSALGRAPAVVLAEDDVDDEREEEDW